MKKFFALLLVSVMLVTAAVPAFAEKTEMVDDLYFNDFKNTQNASDIVSWSDSSATATIVDNDYLQLKGKGGQYDLFAFTDEKLGKLNGENSITMAISYTYIVENVYGCCYMPAFGIDDTYKNGFAAGTKTQNSATATDTEQAWYGNISNLSTTATTRNFGKFIDQSIDLNGRGNYQLIVEVTKGQNPVMSFYEDGNLVAQLTSYENQSGFYTNSYNSYDFAGNFNLDGYLGFCVNGSNAINIDAIAISTTTGEYVREDLLDMVIEDGIYMQTRTDGSAVRFIGVVSFTEEELAACEELGFDISMTYNGVTYSKSEKLTTVYESIVADDVTVYATNYGGTYFYIVEINGLDEAESDIVFEVTGTKNGVAYDTVSFTVSAS